MLVVRRPKSQRNRPLAEGVARLESPTARRIGVQALQVGAAVTIARVPGELRLGRRRRRLALFARAVPPAAGADLFIEVHPLVAHSRIVELSPSEHNAS